MAKERADQPDDQAPRWIDETVDGPRWPESDAAASFGFHVPVEEPQSDVVPATGEWLGRYRIVGELGRGGMGVVLIAEDPRLKRRVAVKVLPESIAQQSAGLRAFEREARILAGIRHPNIATIYSLEDAGGVHFFTMELVPGRTLAERLSEGPLDVSRVVTVGRQTARALEAAHGAGVVHRDFKPANIMITPDREIRVLDFGVAAVVGEGDGGEISGTPGYMSPEQVRGEPPDLRTDVWAFGCVLFECLMGRRAVPGESLTVCSRRTLAGIDLTVLPSETPDAVRELLESCLQLEPEDRLDSMAQARLRLEELETRRVSSTAGRASATAVPNNLPRALTSFVGREQAIDEVRVRLDEHPLVTLSGTGGAGKTRLGLEVGRSLLSSFDDGVWLAELASVQDPEHIAATIAGVFDLREEPGRPFLETVVDHLADKRLLLLLDNCEHLTAPAAAVAQRLLHGAGALRIIATSREALGVPGESVFQVPSLELPAEEITSVGGLRRVDSVRLFVERARGAVRGFQLSEENADDVAEICRRLDGIPLALELAAARVRVIPVSEVAKRLADRFRFLTGGSKLALSRHKTLRATIDWSYDQLEDRERRVLRRLSVFIGGCGLDAIETVCRGGDIDEWEILDCLSLLVDKSLVEVSEHADVGGGVARYRLLESIREYALERLLAEDEAETYRARHRDFYLGLAETAAERLNRPDQGTWFATLEREHDNLHAALQTCLGRADGVALGLRLGAALVKFWLVRGHWTVGRVAIRELLKDGEFESSVDGDRETAVARMRCLEGAGALAISQGDYDEAQPRLEESLTLAQSWDAPHAIAGALNALGNSAQKQGRSEQARGYLEEALTIRRQSEDSAGEAAVLNNLALVAFELNEWDVARQRYDESLAILRGLDDRQAVAVAANGRASVAYHLKDFAVARDLYEEALAISRELGNRRTERNLLNNLGFVARAQGDKATARDLFGQSLDLRRQLGDRRGVAKSLLNLADLSCELGDVEAARGFCSEGLARAQELEMAPLIPEFLAVSASIAAAERDGNRAARLLGAINTIHAAEGMTLSPMAKERMDEVDRSVKAALGAAGYERHHEAGRSLSVAEACRLVERG